VHPDGTINVRELRIDNEMIENGYSPVAEYKKPLLSDSTELPST